jgi:hypothetical protein
LSIKDYLCDELFISSIWLPRLGCISGAIVNSALFLGIWVLSGSYSAFLDAIQPQIGLTIYFSLILMALTIIVILIHDFKRIVSYPFLAPRPLKDLQEIREIYRKDEYIFRDGVIIITGILVVIVFVMVYFLGQEDWSSALLVTLVFVLPIPVAFLAANITKIIFEVLLLIIRYVVSHLVMDSTVEIEGD